MAFELRGTFQDRLVSELRLEGISSPEEANRYLHSVFLPKYNRKFIRKPKVEETAYRAIPQGMNLDRILCIKEERRVQGDNTISYDELNLMYINLKVAGVGGFADYLYWSSSEDDADYAWNQNFSNGVHGNALYKGTALRVRAVRVF